MFCRSLKYKPLHALCVHTQIWVCVGVYYQSKTRWRATRRESESNNSGINHRHFSHLTGCDYLLLCLRSKVSFNAVSDTRWEVTGALAGKRFHTVMQRGGKKKKKITESDPFLSQTRPIGGVALLVRLNWLFLPAAETGYEVMSCADMNVLRRLICQEPADYYTLFLKYLSSILSSHSAFISSI